MNSLIRLDQTALARFANANEAANRRAAQSEWSRFTTTMAMNSARKARNNLSLFSAFLEQVEVVPRPTEDQIKNRQTFGDMLYDGPAAWELIEYGLVTMFIDWLVETGYSVSTINGALSTIKVFSKHALRSGHMEESQQRMIATVEGYNRKRGLELDARRAQTRVGAKKHDFTVLPEDVCLEMKRGQPNTPQGRRNMLMASIFIDHGLRVGEVALLRVGWFNTKQWELHFYRPKVAHDLVLSKPTIRLSRDVRRTYQAYSKHGDCPIMADHLLLRRSKKDGSLKPEYGMSERMITECVGEMASRLGIPNISAHDLRHTWATNEARSGTPLEVLMSAGGWSSPAMPMRYIQFAKVANEGVRWADIGGSDDD